MTAPELMIGWFANALMRGHDEARWKQQREHRLSIWNRHWWHVLAWVDAHIRTGEPF